MIEPFWEWVMTANRSILIFLGLSLTLILLLCSCRRNIDQRQRSPNNAQRPNILFILGDDHTTQAISSYGGILDSLAVTPNIDRLREQGAQLIQVFCTNSICTPSRGTIMTGQYSNKDSVYALGDSLNPNHETVAKIMHRHGYQTALFGKWHLQTEPQGFDYFNVAFLHGGQGSYHNPMLKNANNWDSGGKQYKGFSTDILAKQAIDWMQNRDANKPFMLMLNFHAAHEPFSYAERFDTLYQHTKFPEPKSLLDFYPDKTTRTFEGQILDILGRRFIEHPEYYMMDSFSLDGLNKQQRRKKIYQNFIKAFLRSGATLDDDVGKVLKYLKDNQLNRNTVVIYTADQGYFLGEHGMFDKRMMYDQALKMPFIIRYPKEIRAGSTFDEMILNTDFAPLLLDYAGIPTPKVMQGNSFRSILQGKAPKNWRTAMYYRYWMHQQNPGSFRDTDSALYAYVSVRTASDAYI